MCKKKTKKYLVEARFELARVSPWELKSHALDQLGHPTLTDSRIKIKYLIECLILLLFDLFY